MTTKDRRPWMRMRRWWRRNVIDDMPRTMDAEWMHWQHWAHCTDPTCPCQQPGSRDAS